MFVTDTPEVCTCKFERTRVPGTGRPVKNSDGERWRQTGSVASQRGRLLCVMELRVGCSGWFYWHWKGRFYPETASTRDWFAFYRRRFNTVELNAPFYGWPKPATIKQWRRQATRSFRYCIKVNGLITHENRFKGTAKLIRQRRRVSTSQLVE